MHLTWTIGTHAAASGRMADCQAEGSCFAGLERGRLLCAACTGVRCGPWVSHVEVRVWCGHVGCGRVRCGRMGCVLVCGDGEEDLWHWEEIVVHTPTVQAASKQTHDARAS